MGAASCTNSTLELVPGKVSRFVDLWRDHAPLPGEHPAEQIIAPTYQSAGKVVAELPIVKTPRWSRFLVDSGPLGDKLIAAFETGPVKVKPFGLEGYTLDLDRVERPR